MSQTTEELSVTFDDVEIPLSQPVLEDRIEDIVQEQLNFREVFREWNARDIQSSVVEIPVPNDEMGEPKIVAEGAEFPREQENYRQEILEFDKFGFEVALTMEAMADSRVDVLRDQVDRQAREMREDINERAFDAIQDAIGGETVSQDNGADGTMQYEDILAGREDLVGNSYDPDLLIGDVGAVHDLMASNNFLEASDAQAQLRRDGAIGRVAGMDVVEDDSGLNMTGNNAPGALMVDTDYFGYEGVRDDVTTEEYGEDRTQSEVYRTFARMGWLVTEPDAGVLIEG
jgi:hypothetical protein